MNLSLSFASSASLRRRLSSLRILLAVEFSGDENINILAILFILFYVFAILALIVAAWALGVSRFYKTLFTGEGYMTLSLPVSPMKVVWAKLLSSLIAMFAALVVSVLSLLIFFIGVDSQIVPILGNELAISFEMWFESIAAAPLQFVEEVILFILSIPVSLLLLYDCICLGQLFTNHRKLMTFLIVLGLYFVGEILSITALTPVLDAAFEVSEHLCLWIEILLVAALDVGSFLLVRYILKEKVNLIV